MISAVMIAGYVHDPEHQREPRVVDYQGIALRAVSVGAIRGGGVPR